MLATLRTTNSSPGCASKITSGDTRESQQPITMISGRWPGFGELAEAVLLGAQAPGGEGAVAIDQTLRKGHCCSAESRRFHFIKLSSGIGRKAGRSKPYARDRRVRASAAAERARLSPKPGIHRLFRSSAALLVDNKRESDRQCSRRTSRFSPRRRSRAFARRDFRRRRSACCSPLSCCSSPFRSGRIRCRRCRTTSIIWRACR